MTKTKPKTSAPDYIAGIEDAISILYLAIVDELEEWDGENAYPVAVALHSVLTRVSTKFEELANKTFLLPEGEGDV